MAKYETMLITSAALDEEASAALVGVVVRSSGSATRRPMIATTFNIVRSPFLSQKNYSS